MTSITALNIIPNTAPIIAMITFAIAAATMVPAGRREGGNNEHLIGAVLVELAGF